MKADGMPNMDKDIDRHVCTKFQTLFCCLKTHRCRKQAILTQLD